MVAEHNNGYLVRSLVRVPGSGSNRQLEPVSLDLSNVSSLAARVSVISTLPRTFLRSSQSSSPASREQPNQYQSSVVNATKLRSGPMGAVLKEVTAMNDPKAPKQLKRPLPQDDKEKNEPLTLPSPKVAKIEQQVQNPGSNDTRVNQHIQYILLPVTAAAVLPSVQQVQRSNLTVSAVQTHQNQLQLHAVSTNHNARIVSVASPKTQNVQQKDTSPAVVISTTHKRHQAATAAQSFPGVSNMLQEMDKLKKENENLNRRLARFQNIFKSKESLQYIAKRLVETC